MYKVAFRLTGTTDSVNKSKLYKKKTKPPVHLALATPYLKSSRLYGVWLCSRLYGVWLCTLSCVFSLVPSPSLLPSSDGLGTRLMCVAVLLLDFSQMSWKCMTYRHYYRDNTYINSRIVLTARNNSCCALTAVRPCSRSNLLVVKVKPCCMRCIAILLLQLVLYVHVPCIDNTLHW